MASASVLSPGAPQSFYTVDHLRKPPSSTSPYLGEVVPPTRLYTTPSNHDRYDLSSTTTNTAPPGAASTVKMPAATHAKLHKKALSRITRKDSTTTEEQWQQVEPMQTRERTPPLPPASFDYSTSYNFPPQAQKSPTKQAKEKFKQNLRKLSHAPNEPGDGAINLSMTAEENEKLTGLGLSTPSTFGVRHSRSADVLTTTNGSGNRGHARSYSHVPQISSVSVLYQPTAPWGVSKPASTAYTPTTTTTFDSPTIPLDYSPTTYDIPEETFGRNRGTTVNSSASSEKRPSMRTQSGSSTRFLSSSQTNLAKAGLTRPRRSSTNHSVDTVAGKARTSFERGFSFVSRGKDEPIDPVARAATIQAARQAFDDRQEAKTRKFEEKEQRKAEQQQRKQSKAEERRRRESYAQARQQQQQDASVHNTPELGPGSTSTFSPFPEMVEKPDFVTSGDYANIRPSTSHSAQSVSRDLEEQADSRMQVPPVSRKRAGISQYFRFLSWLKTKLLNLGRSN